VPELEGDVFTLVACLQKRVELLAGFGMLQVDEAVVQGFVRGRSHLHFPNM
jgi:hypothetical protein